MTKILLDNSGINSRTDENPIVELYRKKLINCQVNSLPYLGIVLLVFILSILFYSNPTTYAVKLIDIGLYSPHNEITPNISNAIGFVALKLQQDLKKLIFSTNVDILESEIPAVVL